MFKKWLPALGMLFLLSPGVQAQSAECDVDPALADQSVGFGYDHSNDHYRLGEGQSATLVAEFSACEAAQALVLTLPAGLSAEPVSGDCAVQADGAIRCIPDASVDADGQVTQVLTQPVRAADDIDEPIEGRWSVRADLAAEQRALGPVSIESPIILGGGFVQIGQPGQGQVFNVSPGDSFVLLSQVQYSDDFLGASTIISGGFSYQSFSSGIPGVSCTGTGGSVDCTGGSAGEHEAQLTFDAPTTPGTYNGTYTAEVCFDTGEQPDDCITESESNTFQVIVEDSSCELAQTVGTQSDFSGDTIFEDQPFDFVVDVTAPPGNGADAEDVSFSLTLPSGTTYTGFTGSGWSCTAGGSLVSCDYSGSLAPGASAPQLVLHMLAPDEGEYDEFAQSTSSTCDDVDSTVFIDVDRSEGLGTVVSTKSGPGGVDVGTPFTWTITLDSEGPDAVQDYVLTDTLPSGINFLGVTADSPLSCSESSGELTCSAAQLDPGTYTIDIEAEATGEGNYTNTCTANVSAGSTDDSACEHTVSAAIPPADLAIEKSGPTSVDAATSFSYTVDVSNLGPGSASDITVTDDLPSGVAYDGYDGLDWTCSEFGGTVTCDHVDDLAGGESSLPFNINVTAQDEPADISNCASVEANEDDPAAGNDSDCQATTIEPVTDISLTKVGPEEVDAAETFTYGLELANAGPSTADGIEISDTLPSGVSFISAAGSGWTCQERQSVVSCTYSGSVAGGSSASSLELTVSAPDEGGSIENCADASANQPDSDPSNNQGCHSHSVNPVADLATSKTGPSEVFAADSFAYTVDVSNNGPSTATGISLDDALPPSASYDSFSGTDWSCSESSGTVSCDYANDVSPGDASSPLTITVTAPDEPETLGSCADAAGNEDDPDLANNEDCHPVDVEALSDLSVAKTASDSVVLAGEPFSYTITLSNAGPSTAGTVSVEDPLPSGVDFDSVSGDPPFTCGESGGVVECVADDLSVGSYDIVINAIAPTEVGPIFNSCVVDSDTDDPSPIDPSDCDDGGTDIDPAANIQISKTSSPVPVLAGELLTYQIDIENTGPQDAEDFVLVDDLPPGTTFQLAAPSPDITCSEDSGELECTADPLPVGSHQVEIEVLAPDTPGPITNNCVISSTTEDPDPVGPTDCEDVNDVEAAADLSVSKVASAPSVLAGEPYSYTITVNNDGPNEASNVSLTDPLPEGVAFSNVSADSPLGCSHAGGEVQCSASNLPVGTYDITIDVIAPETPGFITNTCVVDSETGDPDPIDPEDCDDDGIDVQPAADLSVSKVASASEVLAESEYSYTISLENAGPNAAENLQLTDSLPEGVSFISASADAPLNCSGGSGEVNCTADTLPVGSYSIELNVQAPSEPGPITNTCIVSSDTDDPNPITPGACEDGGVDVQPAADLQVSKAASPSPVLAGEPFTYQISLENLGPQAAEDVALSDPLPSEVTFLGVTSSDGVVSCSESGGTVSCSSDNLPIGTYLVDIEVEAPETPGEITNTCVVDATTGDPNPIDPADCDEVTDVDPAADLSVSKFADVSEVPAGEEFNYGIEISNGGPNEADNVVVSDSLPDGVTLAGDLSWTDGPFDCTAATPEEFSCVADTFPVGSHTLDFAVTAPDEPGLITNLCVVDSDTGDPDPIGSADCEDDGVDVVPAADLSVEKTASTSEVLAGEEFSYTITFENAGPNEAENAELIDELSPDLDFQSVSADAPLNCSESGGVVTCDADTLPTGSYDVTIGVTAPDEPGSVMNTCQAQSDTIDPDTTPPGEEPPRPSGDGGGPMPEGGIEFCNDVEVEVLPAADLTVSKSAITNPVLAGEPFTYEISLNNAGPNAADNVALSDPLPGSVSFVSVTASDAALSCAEAGGTVDCSASTLPVGDYTIEIEVEAPDEDGPVLNTCAVSSDTGDPTPVQDGDCEDTTDVEPAADLSFAKTAVDSSTGDPISEVDAGDSFIWQVDLENLGPSLAENIAVSDSVPTAFSVDSVSGSTTAGGAVNCSITGSHDVECQLDALPEGETGTLEIEVTAPDAGGDFTNVCTYSADTEDPDPSNCEGGVDVVPVADVAVSLDAYDDPQAYLDDPASESPVGSLNAGSDGLYVATVTNNGPSEAETVDLVMDLPAEYTGLVAVGDSAPDCVVSAQTMACSLGDLEADESIEALVQMTAPELATSLTTSASATSVTDDRMPSNNSADDTLDIQETPVIGLAKAQTQVTDLGNGEFEAALVFTVINYGNVPLSDVQVSDDFSETFPAGVSWSVSDVSVDGDLTATNPDFDGVQDTSLLDGSETLPVDGEAFIRIDVQFIPGVEPGPFMNQANASALSTLDADVTDESTQGMDPNPDNTDPGNWSEPTPIQYDEDPGIGLAKWIEDRSYLPNGQQRIDLAIKVENWGNTPLLDAQVTDDLVYAFTPEAFLREHGRLAANNVGNTVLDDVVDLTVDGDLSAVNGGFDGVGDTALLSGGEVLPVGGTATIRFGVLISPTDDDFGPYNNRALGTGSSPSSIQAEDYSQAGEDTNPSGSGDPTDDNEPTPIDALNSDLTTAKTLLSTDAGVGDVLSWEVSVTNLGPDGADGWVLTDTLPDNVTFEGVQILDGPINGCDEDGGVITCDGDGLDVGQSASIQVDALAPNSTQDVVNTCSVTAASPDPDLDNNSCESSVFVGPRADLSVSKTALSDSVLAGERIDYLITIENAGPNGADDVVITDDLPAGTTFVDVTADSPLVCSETGGSVTCDAGSLPVGIYTVQIGVLAPDDPGPITNTCVVDSGTVDPNPIDPDDCDDGGLDVDPSANLSISKVASESSVPAGTEFSYLITVDNVGPNAAEDVLVDDPLPAEVSFVDVIADSPFDCVNDAGVVGCLADTLPVGTYTIEVVVTAPDQPGTVNNVCVIDSETGDPEPVDPEDCDSGDTDIIQPATLSMTKEADPGDVAPGAVFDWVISVEQSGPSDITGVVIGDEVPDSSTVLGVTADTPLDCSNDGNDVTCTADTLTPGTYEIRVETEAPATPGPIDNVCVLDADNGVSVDPDECDGTVIIEERTTLNVSVTSSRSQVGVGDDWTYTVEMANDGDVAASNIELDLSHNGSGDYQSDGGSAGSDCLDGISEGQSSCTFDVLEPGESVVLTMPMTAMTSGQDQLSAQAATTTLLTPDSNLQDSAGVIIGVPAENSPYPIPVMNRWGAVALILLVMMLGVIGLRMSGRREPS